MSFVSRICCGGILRYPGGSPQSILRQVHSRLKPVNERISFALPLTLRCRSRLRGKTIITFCRIMSTFVRFGGQTFFNTGEHGYFQVFALLSTRFRKIVYNFLHKSMWITLSQKKIDFSTIWPFFPAYPVKVIHIFLLSFRSFLRPCSHCQLLLYFLSFPGIKFH